VKNKSVQKNNLKGPDNSDRELQKQHLKKRGKNMQDCRHFSGRFQGKK